MIRTRALAASIVLALPALAHGDTSAVPVIRSTEAPVEVLLQEAAAAWSRRAEGRSEDRAALEPIETAIVRWADAWQREPASARIAADYLRALFFRAQYATRDERAAADAYARAREVSERVLDVLSDPHGGREHVRGLDAEAVSKLYADTPAVGEVYFWAAIHWGGWGRSQGLVRALTRGLAPRLHRYTRIAVGLAPGCLYGGPWRLLARLHAAVPHVPFYTGWVDRDAALPAAQRALEFAPDEPGNHMLLAITLLDVAPERADEARALLREISEFAARDESIVEDLRLARSARERLSQLSP